MNNQQPYLKVLGSGYRKFCALETLVCAILFLFIVGLVFASALLRKIGLPIQWSNDVSQLLFAWLAFLGGDIALRKGSLMGVGLITRKLPGTVQKFLSIFCYFLMLIILFIVIKFGFALSARNWTRAFQSLTISYSWVTLSLPISAICMVMSIIRNIYNEIVVKNGKENLSCGC